MIRATSSIVSSFSNLVSGFRAGSVGNEVRLMDPFMCDYYSVLVLPLSWVNSLGGMYRLVLYTPSLSDTRREKMIGTIPEQPV